MRIVLCATALLIAGCLDGEVANEAAAPAGGGEAVVYTPDADPMVQAMDCVVHIGLLEAPDDRATDYDQASDAWRAALVRENGEEGAAQLIGSHVNMLGDTPPETRAAAADWCAANAPG